MDHKRRLKLQVTAESIFLCTPRLLLINQVDPFNIQHIVGQWAVRDMEPGTLSRGLDDQAVTTHQGGQQADIWRAPVGPKNTRTVEELLMEVCS